MRPTTWLNDPNVQFTLDIDLPSLVVQQLRACAQEFLAHSSHHASNGRLLAHLKRTGPQVGCHIHLFTEHGHYYAFETGWDVRSVFRGALQSAEQQYKRFLEQKIEHNQSQSARWMEL
jgi:hypothetical protein